MTTKQIGIDHTGTWTPAQYAIDAGWTRECVEATARLGVADEDAEGLTAEQKAALLDWCKGRMAAKYTVATDGIKTTIEAQDEDEAARKFAAAEKIVNIECVDDLVAHYEARDGWCRINPQ